MRWIDTTGNRVKEKASHFAEGCYHHQKRVNQQVNFRAPSSREVQMEYLSLILSFLAGLVSGYTIRVVISNSKSVRFISQKGNVAGRDIVAGDNTKQK